MYQSRLGSSRDRREATNHGWAAEVWLSTMSKTTFIPRAWISRIRHAASASEPYSGAIAKWSLMS